MNLPKCTCKCLRCYAGGHCLQGEEPVFGDCPTPETWFEYLKAVNPGRDDIGVRVLENGMLIFTYAKANDPPRMVP